MPIIVNLFWCADKTLLVLLVCIEFNVKLVQRYDIYDTFITIEDSYRYWIINVTNTTRVGNCFNHFQKEPEVFSTGPTLSLSEIKWITFLTIGFFPNIQLIFIILIALLNILQEYRIILCDSSEILSPRHKNNLEIYLNIDIHFYVNCISIALISTNIIHLFHFVNEN
jgi:hypothetical protein